MKKKNADVVLDNYKLKIFRKNLKNAGFKWKETPAENNLTVLNVDFDPSDLNVLEKIIRESNNQARKNK